jgi:3-oxoacyl-[acyl-carrier-protein] synthase-3
VNGHATARGSIVGVVSAVPARVITNADCPDPAAADEAAKLTGVLERRWVGPGQSARTLCTDAAKRLLEGLAWAPASIDVMVYVTQTPEGAVPADVYRIAAELGLPVSCACLQINWSCAGYVYGLWTTMRLLQPGQRALLLVGDATSTIADPGDRATAPLFGDAGSATAIVSDDLYRTASKQYFVLGTDGSGADKLCQSDSGGQWPFLKMDGAAVFNYTLRTVPSLVADVLRYGRPDFLLFHQANSFMLKHLVKKSNLAERFDVAVRVPTNIARFGNCSCASIPLLMVSEIRHNLLHEGMRLALFGFGAGWAHAGAMIECAAMEVAELIEV